MFRSRGFWAYAVAAVAIFAIVNHFYGFNAGYGTMLVIGLALLVCDAITERSQRLVLVVAAVVAFGVYVLTQDIANAIVAAPFAWVVLTLIVQMFVQRDERRTEENRE